MTVQALKHKKIIIKKITEFPKYESHDFNKQSEEDIEVTNLWLKLDFLMIKKPDI